jgi:hypothetical protein
MLGKIIFDAQFFAKKYNLSKKCASITFMALFVQSKVSKAS